MSDGTGVKGLSFGGRRLEVEVLVVWSCEV